MTRKPYPSDVSDEEWNFVAPYLALIDEQAPQRRNSLREVFNALRWLACAGAPWRLVPHDLPPWAVVYQQFRRWEEAGCFEAMVSDMRSIIRAAQGRQGQPSAVILDGRTMQSSCESGPRAGYDGYKRRKGSKVHMAVDTLGHLIALTVTPADEQERAQVDALCEQVHRQRAIRSSWSGQTKATRASRPKATRLKTALNCKWSSCLRRRRALCCCPGAGSWSAASAGWPGSGA